MMTDEELAEIEARAHRWQSVDGLDAESIAADVTAYDVPALVAEVRRLRTIIGTGQQLSLEERMAYLPDSLMAQVMAQFEGDDADA